MTDDQTEYICWTIVVVVVILAWSSCCMEQDYLKQQRDLAKPAPTAETQK